VLRPDAVFRPNPGRYLHLRRAGASPRAAPGVSARASRRECQYTRELDLETLVWTRGANFPLSSLDGRLMCPRCRSRRVAVMFQSPTVSQSARG
jgi:hypothetical protein